MEDDPGDVEDLGASKQSEDPLPPSADLPLVDSIEDTETIEGSKALDLGESARHDSLEFVQARQRSLLPEHATQDHRGIDVQDHRSTCRSSRSNRTMSMFPR